MSSAGMTVRNVSVFDGERLVAGADSVVVDGGRVVRVGGGLRPASGTRVVDGGGGCLTPGLIDGHVHLRTVGEVRQAAALGVTALVDMGNHPSVVFPIRTEVAARRWGAVHAAGWVATAPFGHPLQLGFDGPTLDGAVSASRFVTDRVAEGSAFIKIMIEGRLTTLQPDTVAALAAAARLRGVLSVAHVGTEDEAVTALHADVDGIAHAWPGGDHAAVPLAAERDAFVVGTLSTLRGGNHGLAGDSRLSRWLTDEDRRWITQARSQPVRGYERIAETVRRLAHAGVDIVAGTDAGNSGVHIGASLHAELELLCAVGVSPRNALRSATSVPARRFGLSGRGRITAGARADLVLLHGDPLRDITATRDIAGVWVAGEPVDRDAALHARQDEIAAAFAAIPAAPTGELLGQPERWRGSDDSTLGGTTRARMSIRDGVLRVDGQPAGGFTSWVGACYSPDPNPTVAANASATPRLTLTFRGGPGELRVGAASADRGPIPAMRALVHTTDWTTTTVDLRTLDRVDPRQILALYLTMSNTTEPTWLELRAARLH